jgi:tetratricopeptide (TPR) repeat protein
MILGDDLIRVPPEGGATLRAEGIALAKQAQTRTGSEADEFITSAEQKFQAALAINPNDPVTLCTWARALGRFAQTKAGAERARFFGLAADKFQAAHAVRPDEPEILRAWAAALTAQAMVTTGSEAAGLYDLAEKNFLAALKINPDGKTIRVWSHAVAARAKAQSGEESDRFREKGILLSKEAGAPGSAAYSLARLAARNGSNDECGFWFEICERHGSLPSRPNVEQDPAFSQVLSRVRGRAWFRDLLDRIYDAKRQ